MIKNVFIIIAIIFFASCAGKKQAPASREIKPIETTYDTIKIVNEELEYQIIILELGFDSWLVTQRPIWFYSNPNLAFKNHMLVTEWNQRVVQPVRYQPLLYQQFIDYSPHIDYGIEVNYLLYMYFKFFAQKYNVRFYYL